MMSSTQTFTSPAVNSGSTAATMMGSVQRFCQRWRAASWAGVNSGRSPSSRLTSPWTRLRVRASTPRSSARPRGAPAAVGERGAAPRAHGSLRRCASSSPAAPASSAPTSPTGCWPTATRCARSTRSTRRCTRTGRRTTSIPRSSCPRGDVRDHDALGAALEGVDAVVHLAAAVGVGQSMYEIERYVSVNAVGCAVLLEEVVGPPRPRAPAGGGVEHVDLRRGPARRPGERPPRPRARPAARGAARPRGSGTCSATTASRSCRSRRPRPSRCARRPSTPSPSATTRSSASASARPTACPTVALRFFNVYGARQALSNPYTGVAAIFASRLLNGRAPLIFEDGEQSRDFVDVRDVARALALALESEDAVGHAINVGTGVATSVHTVATTLARGLGVDVAARAAGPVPRRRHPLLLRRPGARRAPAGLPRRDPVRARA